MKLIDKAVDMAIDVIYLSVLALLINVWAGVALHVWGEQLRPPFFWGGIGILLTVGVIWLRPHAKRASRRARR